jgi:cell wall-associated NlpC family hydrolase
VSVLTAAAATAVAISAQAGAQAAPQLTLSQATKEVAADRQAADVAGQQYDQAQTQEQALQQRVALLQNEISQEQSTLNTQEAQLGAEAAAQYRAGAVDPSVQLMLSSDPTAYLNQASVQGELDSSQAAVYSDVQAQQQLLDRQKAEASSELASEQALLKQMQQSKAAAQAKLKQAQSIVDSLTPVQQAQVNAGGGYGSLGGDRNGSTMSPSQVDLSGISSAAQTAMQAALSKVGIAPYEWGGSGPDAFDCSGLVMWAYAHAGISLPHSSYSDESVGSYVSPSDIQVGDIVVLEGGAHVGLYAGNGMLLNAPEYGYTVSIMPISDFGGVVAVRRV